MDQALLADLGKTQCPGIIWYQQANFLSPAFSRPIPPSCDLESCISAANSLFIQSSEPLAESFLFASKRQQLVFIMYQTMMHTKKKLVTMNMRRVLTGHAVVCSWGCQGEGSALQSTPLHT